MAINIKEILTSDSDPIRVDKTNYNFDQLVANGGGPIGIKGQKGELGDVGNTGAKGEKGDAGAKGETGATGADVNNWGRVDHTSTTDTSILKPKKDDDDTEPASIILGDVGYTDGVNDGVVNPNAWLNIIIPDGSAIYSNFASLLNGTTSKVNFSSTTLSGVDTYKITHDIGSSNDVNFEINIKNEVLINGADALNLTSDGVININAGNNDIVIGPISSTSTAKLDVRFNNTFVRGDLTIEGNNGGYVKIPVGTTAQRPAGALGMIRYNSNLDVGFGSNLGSPEAFVPHPDGNYWKPLTTLVDSDGDTFISPDYNTNDGTENVLTISVGEDTGGGSYIKDIVGTFGETVSDGSTNLNRTFTYNNVIYAANDILVANDKGLRVKQNTSTPGSNQVAAQNSGVVAANRTLADYFYRESNLQYGVSSIAGNTQPFKFPNEDITIDPNSYRYTSDAIIALAFKTDLGATHPREKVGIIIDHTTSKMSYVKVGHLITVWGRLDYFPYNLDINSLQSSDHINFSGENSSGTIDQPSRRAAFTIGRPEDFPYTSSLNRNRVVFPISVNLKSHNNTSGNDVNYFGVIEPGTNVFTIMEVDDKTGFISGTGTEETEDHYAKYLNINDLALLAGDVDEVITLEYTFSMPTDVNSYDITADNVSAYVEDDSVLLSPQGPQ
jgi:hypothetical protein